MAHVNGHNIVDFLQQLVELTDPESHKHVQSGIRLRMANTGIAQVHALVEKIQQALQRGDLKEAQQLISEQTTFEPPDTRSHFQRRLDADPEYAARCEHIKQGLVQQLDAEEEELRRQQREQDQKDLAEGRRPEWDRDIPIRGGEDTEKAVRYVMNGGPFADVPEDDCDEFWDIAITIPDAVFNAGTNAPFLESVAQRYNPRILQLCQEALADQDSPANRRRILQQAIRDVQEEERQEFEAMNVQPFDSTPDEYLPK